MNVILSSFIIFSATDVPDLEQSREVLIAWIAFSCLYFVSGLLCGWLIWRRFRSEANRLERENERLFSAYERREEAYIEHKDIVTALIEQRSPAKQE